MTSLDHLYGPSSQIDSLDGKIKALDTKINNVDTKINGLANISVKNNIKDQRIPQQRISEVPTNNEHIMRLYEMKYTRVVNHLTSLSAGNVHEWTPTAYDIGSNNIHEVVVKVAVAGVDYLFGTTLFATSSTYKNMGPIFTFAKDNNWAESGKLKVWLEDNKFKLMSSIPLSNVIIYSRKWSFK